MKPLRASALVGAAGLLLAACVSVSNDPQPHPVAPVGVGGEALLAAGDFDGAVRAFQSRIAAGDDSPVTRELLLNARRRSATAHANAAVRAADDGDADRARNELAHADDMAADALAVKDAHAAVDQLLAKSRRAAELRQDARRLLASDPQQAERILEEAQSLAPDAEDLPALRREAALRAEADRSVQRGAEAWDAGDRDRVVRELSGARFDGKPIAKAEALRRRIENDVVAESTKTDEAGRRAAYEFASAAGLHPAVVRTLRESLVEKLLAGATNLRETRRPAVAALLELEAKHLRGDVKTPALDQVREEATATILVAPFDDATGGKVDGMRLARGLRERLALDALGGGLPMRVMEDAPEARAAWPTALVLSGRVTAARRSDGRAGRETRNVRYQTGTDAKPNPKFDAIGAQLADAQAILRVADDDKRNADAYLASIKSLPFITTPGKPRLSDVEYQSRLAAAQSKADRADAALKRAKDAEFALRQQALVTPRSIDEPVWAEYPLVITTRVKTAQLTAHVDLARGGETLLSQDVSADAQHKETISDAFAPAGIVADPDDTPDDAEMASRAADDFAEKAAGRVRAAAEAAARHFLVAARAAETSGKRDAAAEGYAMYLLATSDVVSPERSDAARALAELVGVRVPLRTTQRKEEPK